MPPGSAAVTATFTATDTATDESAVVDASGVSVGALVMEESRAISSVGSVTRDTAAAGAGAGTGMVGEPLGDKAPGAEQWRPASARGGLGWGWVGSGRVAFGSVRVRVRFGSFRFGSVRSGSVMFGSVWFGLIGMGWGGVGASRVVLRWAGLGSVFEWGEVG